MHRDTATRLSLGDAPRRPNAAIALVLAVTGCAYLTGLRAPRDFVSWDDTLYIRDNSQMWDFDGLWRIWFTFESDQYYPLTFSSFWLEYRLWGDWPTGYFLSNVALHLVNAYLVFLLARRLGASLAAATIAAALFGAHPLQVSSVAWIAQRKNTLSTALALTAMLAFLRYARCPHTDVRLARRSYRTAMAAFIGSTLSKTAVATLPISMALAGWLSRDPAGRDAPTPKLLLRRTLNAVVPMLAVAAVLGLVTVFVEVTGASAQLPAAARPLVAAGAVWFYLGKLLWPQDLQAVYPQWDRSLTNAWLWWAAVGLPPLLAVLAFAARRLGRAFTWGVLHAAMCLLPVIGIVRFDYLRLTPVADHFLYLALVGACVALGIAGDAISSRLPRAVTTAGAALMLLLLAGKTIAQVNLWRDGHTLWTTTLAHNPDCAVAHNNLAMLRARTDPIASEVIAGFRAAVRCDPSFTLARINLAQALERAGETAEALAVFAEAAQRDPRDAAAQFNLGLALWHAGRRDEALACYRHALQLRRDYPEAWTNLGTAMLEAGQTGNAVQALQTASMLRPKDATTRIGLGQALLASGDLIQALVEFRNAQRLAPRSAAPPMNIGLALLRRGDTRGALDALRTAVSVDPNDPAATLNLGAFLAQSNQLDAAEPLFRKAAALDPENAQAHANLGAALVQRGEFRAAIASLERAVALRPDYANAAFHLGRAHAGLGEWTRAADCLRRVVQAAPLDVEAHFQLGSVLERGGALSDAAREFEAVLKIQPERADAREALTRCTSQPASAP